MSNKNAVKETVIDTNEVEVAEPTVNLMSIETELLNITEPGALFNANLELDAETEEMLRGCYDIESKPFKSDIAKTAVQNKCSALQAYVVSLTVAAINKRFVDAEKATVKLYDKSIAKMKAQKVPQFIIDGLMAEVERKKATFKKAKKNVAANEAKTALSADASVVAVNATVADTVPVQ